LVAIEQDVRYLFLVNTSLQGNAPPAWLPPSALSFKQRAKPDPAARGRRLVGRWLRELTGIGVKIAAGITELARWRRVTGTGEAVPIDINLGWVLVRRAMHWMAALRTRLDAENAAAKIGIDPPEQVIDPSDSDVDQAVKRLRAAAVPKPAREPAEGHDVSRNLGRAVSIEGMSAADVVAQICADLGAAATLLSEADARRQIEAIAAAAQALLGESTAALLPAPKVLGRLYGEPPAQATMSGVVPPAVMPSPDTG
jgi:hypothetical protein